MKRVKSLFFILPAIFLIILPVKVQAETKTLNITQDTYANEVYPDNNYGATGSVVISNKYTTRLGYLQFESLNLPEQATINRATLKINLSEVHYSDTAKLNVGPITNSWNETAVTWNSKPTINQTLATEAIISISSTGDREIEITSLARKWHDGTTANHGLFIYPYGFLYGAPETEYALGIKSKESGDQKPVIEIEYQMPDEPTPTPTLTPTPAPTTLDEEETILEEETIPTPEEELTPTPQPEATAKVLGILSPLQTLGASLILIGLIILISGLILFSRKKGKKTVKEDKKE